MVLERGMRIGVLVQMAVVRPRCCVASGESCSLLSGMRKPGHGYAWECSTQDLAADLPLDESPLEWITTNAPTIPPEKIRSILGALGLHGDMALRKLGACSVGNGPEWL